MAQPRGGGGSAGERRPEVVIARRLRRELTLPEAMLWERLRGGKAGAKFRRQHPVGPYVVDFFCRVGKLVVKVDGEIHNRGDRPAHDEVRQRFLVENGYQVVRIAASRVLRDADATADAIGRLMAAPLHHPAVPDGLPPRSGEE